MVESLDAFLSSLPIEGREVFIQRVRGLEPAGSRFGWQQALHLRDGRKRASAERAMVLEKATYGAVRCEELRPDIDWTYLASRATQSAGTALAASPPGLATIRRRNRVESPLGQRE